MVAYMELVDYFTVWSEFEVGKGFSDIYLMPRLDRYLDKHESNELHIRFVGIDFLYVDIEIICLTGLYFCCIFAAEKTK